jgi:hypothetical protein
VNVSTRIRVGLAVMALFVSAACIVASTTAGSAASERAIVRLLPSF